MSDFVDVLCASHFGIVRHLQAVGHVAGEADVEYGCAYAFVLYDVHHVADQRSCLPGEGAAGLEYDVQPGVALV